MIKVYKANIIEGLKYLSDYDLQRLAWIEDPDICSSFSDEVAIVFEENGLEKALDQGKTVFGKKADSALRELNEEVEHIGYNRPEKELIDSPEMQIVREKAAHALELILKSDGSESTVEIIE